MRWAAAAAVVAALAIICIRATLQFNGWVRHAPSGSGAGTLELRLPADAPVHGWTRWSRPTLIVRCNPNEGALVTIATGLPIEVESGVTRSVAIRFDDEPSTISQWVLSDDRQSLTSPAADAVTLTARMAHAGRLSVAFVALRTEPLEARFSLAGFAPYWAEAAEACRSEGRNPGRP